MSGALSLFLGAGRGGFALALSSLACAACACACCLARLPVCPLPLSVHVLEIGVFTARYVTCGKTMMHTTWAYILLGHGFQIITRSMHPHFAKITLHPIGSVVRSNGASDMLTKKSDHNQRRALLRFHQRNNNRWRQRGSKRNNAWLAQRFFSFTFDGVRLKRWVPCTTNTINTSLIGVCWKHTMSRSVMSTMGKTRCLNLGSFGTDETSQILNAL